MKLTDSERAAVLADLAAYRVQAAHLSREIKADLQAMVGHTCRELAAELAHDAGCGAFHRAMSFRFGRSAEAGCRRRADLIKTIRELEGDLT